MPRNHSIFTEWKGVPRSYMEPSMPERYRESLAAIAERLEIAREALGYHSQTAFIQAIGEGMTAQKWSNYLSGLNRIPVPTATILCRKFGLTLDWIYHGDPSALRHALAEKLDEISRRDRRKPTHKSN